MSRIYLFLPLMLFDFSVEGTKENSFEFDFEYQTILKHPGRVEAWIPLPQSGPFQSIRDLSIQTKQVYRLEKDSVYGNLFLYVQPFELSEPETITVTYRVCRNETEVLPEQLKDSQRDLFLNGSLMVPRDDRFRLISEQLSIQGGNFSSRVYSYVLEHMSYDKSGEGWGQGDAIYACDIGKGNCTDYHSLFNAVVRSQGIPARFNIGFPIPEGEQGAVDGYHCWTEYYIEGQGWIPVDISEADKHPETRQYYFGHLDPRRIKLTVGRDIQLPGGSSVDVVNFAVYPYVKVNGKETGGIATRYTFKSVD